MLILKKIATAVVLTMSIFTALSAEEYAQNPYDILQKHFEAMGGLDRLRAEKSYHFEAGLSAGGLNGTLEFWKQSPDKIRFNVDLGIFKMSQGENNDYNWSIDPNGKLQIVSNFDNAQIKRRKLKRLFEEYKFADPNLKTFTVVYKGTDKVEDVDCHIVEITNSINVDKLTFFINSDNYLLEKAISLEGTDSHDSYYSDYRQVKGLMVAFKEKQVDHQSGQIEEIAINSYESNPEIDPSIFEAPGKSAKDYRFTEGNSSEYIPFRFLENSLYIPVIIDCRENWWILDTGAGMSVIDKEYADMLELEPEGDIKGVGTGGSVDVQLTRIPSFKLQGIEFDPQTVAVIDLSEINKLLPIKIAGILGFDFLSRFVTRVDYANELVSFYEPDSFKYSGSGRELGFHLKENVFMVEATLDEIHSGTWLFDLGATGSSINDIYAHWKGFDKRKGIDGLSRGAGNYIFTRKAQFEKLELAGFEIDKPIVHFATGVTDTVFTADDIGALGNDIFRHFVLYCDYANERLILEKGDNFNKEFDRDRSGLRIKRNDSDEYEVLFVPDNTPAKKAKFQVGDIIEKINGIDTNYLDGLHTIRMMLKEKPGTKYEFLVMRDGKEKKLKLKLEDLFKD